MNNKRYVGLFIAPGMCDGIYDTYNDPSYVNNLSSEEIIDIMNDANNQTEVWKRKYDEMKNKYEELKEKIENNKTGEK